MSRLAPIANSFVWLFCVRRNQLLQAEIDTMFLSVRITRMNFDSFFLFLVLFCLRLIEIPTNQSFVVWHWTLWSLLCFDFFNFASNLVIHLHCFLSSIQCMDIVGDRSTKNKLQIHNLWMWDRRHLSSFHFTFTATSKTNRLPSLQYALNQNESQKSQHCHW